MESIIGIESSHKPAITSMLAYGFHAYRTDSELLDRLGDSLESTIEEVNLFFLNLKIAPTDSVIAAQESSPIVRH